MPKRYYLKKHRQDKRTKKDTPLFLVRRPLSGDHRETWQVRYTNLCKTFYHEHEAVAYAEGLLNGNVSLIETNQVLIGYTINPKKKEIIVEMKGVLCDHRDNENTYFIEKYQGEYPSDNQLKHFIESCVLKWKMVFVKQNRIYAESLYKRKFIGYDHDY